MMKKTLFKISIGSLLSLGKNAPSSLILEAGISKLIDSPIELDEDSRFCDIAIDNVDYEINEHFPSTFANIRKICGEDELYRETFSYESAFTDFKSNSLGSRNNKVEFFWSKDKHFMIKSLSNFEYDQLFKMLFKYEQHMRKYPESLLSTFCGLYSFRQLKRGSKEFFQSQTQNQLLNSSINKERFSFVKLFRSRYRARKPMLNDKSESIGVINNNSSFLNKESVGESGVRSLKEVAHRGKYHNKKPDKYYIIMKNVFDPRVELNRQYDLKGSYLGRKTKIPSLKKLKDASNKVEENDSLNHQYHSKSSSTSLVENNRVDIDDQMKTVGSNSTTFNKLVLKDLNFIELNQSKIDLNSHDREKFLAQLVVDVEFLRSIAVMDYSLLLGISSPSSSSSSLLSAEKIPSMNETLTREMSLMAYSQQRVCINDVLNKEDMSTGTIDASSSSTLLSRVFPFPSFFKFNSKQVLENKEKRVSNNTRRVNVTTIIDVNENENDSSAEQHDLLVYSNSLKTMQQKEKARRGRGHWKSRCGGEVYFISIIDFLQPYSAKKFAETLGKSLVHRPDLFSSVDPHSYAKRFVRFIVSKVIK